MQLFKNETHFDFMGKIKPAMAFSSLLILVGLISIAISGGLKYGIDFAGGTLVQLQFKNPPDIEVIRDGLKTIGLGDSTIQEFGSKKDILIRVEKSEEKLEAVGAMVRRSLSGEFNIEEITLERVEMVGPKVGRDLREKALLSILYAIIGIVIYISWRFEFQYAIAAIIALIHDAIIVIGSFAILGEFLGIEISTMFLVALLTIIGYSVNDTIVVFDKIRENVLIYTNRQFTEVVNLSISETLGRSLNTSFTLLLTLLALFLFGGATIREFLYVLIIGVIAGTYSSIAIASQILVVWDQKKIGSF